MRKILPGIIGAALTSCSVLTTNFAGSAYAQQPRTDVQKVMSGVRYACDKPNANTTSNVTVALLPIISNSALFAADDLGVFKKHGLTVEYKMLGSLPPTISAVQGGAVNFAFTGTIGAFQAIDRGVDLIFVAPFAGIEPGFWKKMQAGEKGYTRETSAILVDPKKGFDTPGQLSGKVVAVPDAKGQFELTARAVIKKHGGDPDSVKFVVMSYADSVNALMAGQVDAAMSMEPPILKAEAAGYKIISWPGVEALEEGPTSVFAATSVYILKNPEIVARFNCVVREAAVLGRQQPDLLRRTTAHRQNVDPVMLANATVPYFYTAMDMRGLARFYTLQKEAGFVRRDIDLDKLVIPQALGE